MYNPPHPGSIVRRDCIEELGLTVTDAAEGLGASRSALSEVLNGRMGISPEMALRFELTGWGVAEGWLRAQAAYDLWQLQNRPDKITVRRFSESEPA